MERGREERKNLSSTSWGENVRQTVFVEMHVKEALHLLQITSWQSLNLENSLRGHFISNSSNADVSISLVCVQEVES